MAGGVSSGSDDALPALAGRAHLLFRLHRASEAVQLLRLPLERLLQRARQGAAVAAADVRLATALALRAAEQSGAASWLSYVFDQHSASGIVPDANVVERLCRLTSKLPGVSVMSFRDCVDRLSVLESKLDAAQRSRVHRLRELEEVVVGSFLAWHDARRARVQS